MVKEKQQETAKLEEVSTSNQLNQPIQNGAILKWPKLRNKTLIDVVQSY